MQKLTPVMDAQQIVPIGQSESRQQAVAQELTPVDTPRTEFCTQIAPPAQSSSVKHDSPRVPGTPHTPLSELHTSGVVQLLGVHPPGTQRGGVMVKSHDSPIGQLTDGSEQSLASAHTRSMQMSPGVHSVPEPSSSSTLSSQSLSVPSHTSVAEAMSTLPG